MRASSKSSGYTGLALAGALLCAGCTGQGQGSVRGVVNMPLCNLVRDNYNLGVHFFGATWFNRTLNVRLQGSGSAVEFTDYMELSVDDTEAVALALAASTERDPDGNTVVTLPVGPDNPLSPYPVGAAPTSGTLVHATLIPNLSCGRAIASRLGDNLALRSQRGWITFRRIYNPGRGASPAGAALPPDTVTEVSSFYFELADDRAVGPTRHGGDYDNTAGNAQLAGSLRFEFSRGVPAQPFFP